MAHNKKLVLGSKKKGQIIYVVKAGNEIIWEGENIHKRFRELKAIHKGQELTVGWKPAKEYISV